MTGVDLPRPTLCKLLQTFDLLRSQLEVAEVPCLLGRFGLLELMALGPRPQGLYHGSVSMISIGMHSCGLRKLVLDVQLQLCQTPGPERSLGIL